MKVVLIAGARPNVMKIAPVMEVLKRWQGIGKGGFPGLWDGNVAERIVQVLLVRQQPTTKNFM